ncbi:MAG: lysophospholipid acyltransferase family protein [Prevotella sp.]|nr:lysophospholipid acyltransferase family protein [Prevotella sp.]
MKAAYHIIYSIWYVLSLLPMRVHYVFSDMLFFVVFHVLHYRRRTVWVNLVTSFPEKPEEELLDIERRFYRWFCDYIAETVKLLTISRSEIRRRMVFKNPEVIDRCVASGQSCAVYLGHYCNWELVTSLPLWVAGGAQCGQIYHPLENKLFDRLFLRLRERLGAVCIPMNETLRRIVEYGREGRPVVIGYISDQVPFWWNMHHWCDFLHHDTPVLSGTERIARKLDHAVFYLEVNRVARGRYEAEFRPITRAPREMAEYEITDIYFRMLEETIRRNPEYWLWTHKRWKRTREKFNLRFEVIDGKIREK